MGLILWVVADYHAALQRVDFCSVKAKDARVPMVENTAAVAVDSKSVCCVVDDLEIMPRCDVCYRLYITRNPIYVHC